MSIIVPLIPGLATLLAVVIALFTLLELSRQRKASYRPEIGILGKSFLLSKDRLSGTDLVLDWHSEEEDLSINNNNPHIKLINIGFGTAKNVNAKWDYDIDSFIESINNIDEKNRTYTVEKGDLFLELRKDGKSIYSTNAFLNTWKFEHIIPVNVVKGGRELYLPPAYVLLISILLSFAVKDGGLFENLYIPELKLRLEFKDIGNGRHVSIYKLRCLIESIEIIHGGKTGTEPKLRLNFSEVS